MKQPVSFHPTASFAGYLLGARHPPTPAAGLRAAGSRPRLPAAQPPLHAENFTSAAPRLQRPPCGREPPEGRGAAPRPSPCREGRRWQQQEEAPLPPPRAAPGFKLASAPPPQLSREPPPPAR